MDCAKYDSPYVLLLEDDAATRQLVKDILEEEVGIAVLKAADGITALRMLADARRSPALLVVDLMLPNMDGETFMAEVRRLYGPDLPVIVMSAMDPTVVRSSAECIGARGVVLKPFTLEDFVAEVTDALQLEGKLPSRQAIVDLDDARRLRIARRHDRSPECSIARNTN